MQRFRLGIAVLFAFAMVLSMAAVRTTAQSANFAGTWAMTMSGGGGRGGGGGNRGGGGDEQSLTITQDGDKITVDHKTRRGENTYAATVSGNTISWTEQREGRDGNTMQIQFKATLDGDTLKGTMSGGRFNRDFTATRAKQAPAGS
jgi:hypothetical protein